MKDIPLVDEIEVITRSAKATEEVARTAGKGIDAAREAGGFFRAVFGQVIVDGVGLYADKVRYRRYGNELIMWAALERQIKHLGLEHFREVPPKVGIPLLEQALLEDEEDLHDLWANLLASALNPDAADPKRKYVSVLSQLDATDAAVLKALRIEWEGVNKTKMHRERGVRYAPGVDGVGPHDEIAIITLARMGLIRPAPTEFDSVDGGSYESISFGEPVQVIGDFQVVQLTAFGLAFCEAVGIDPNETEETEAAA